MSIHRQGAYGRARFGRTGPVVLLSVALAALAGGGCSSPNAANITLRKENARLRESLEQLEAERKATSGTRVVATRPGPANVNLDELYTVTGLSFGRLTGVDGSTLRVYAIPTDRQGDVIKAAGGFQVLAYDLSRGPNALVGQWTFTPEQAAKAWNGKGLLYTYVLECPLETASPPSGALSGPLRIRVTFTDTLTGRTLTEERDARVMK